MTQYLVVRPLSKPRTIAACAPLHSIIPSGELMTTEQATFLYGVARFAPRGAEPHCRYITEQRQLFRDDGMHYFYKVTDTPPKTAKLAKPTAAEIVEVVREADYAAPDSVLFRVDTIPSPWSQPISNSSIAGGVLSATATNTVETVSIPAPVAERYPF